jgi:hypothetical protein
MHQWAQWLPLAEWWYNTTYHGATKMTPYELFMEKTLVSGSYVLGTSKVHAIDRTLHTKEAIIYILKDNLVMAQNQMKQQVDQHRSECSFNEGDQVFLSYNLINIHHSKIKFPKI